MREILFRGKRIDNGEWVYGSFCMDALEQKNGLCGVDGFIRLYDPTVGKMQMHEVDRETVGQYTGLTDKYGEMIYEDDILRCSDGMICRVEWDKDNARFLGFASIGKERYIAYVGREPKSEVIGNIYNNPELLEV